MAIKRFSIRKDLKMANELIWKRKYFEDSDWDKHWYLDVNDLELELSQVTSNGFQIWKLQMFGLDYKIHIDVDWSQEDKAKEIAIEHFESILKFRIKKYQETLDILNNTKKYVIQSNDARPSWLQSGRGNYHGLINIFKDDCFHTTIVSTIDCYDSEQQATDEMKKLIEQIKAFKE